MLEHKLYNPDADLYFSVDAEADAMAAAALLSRNGYVVMISREEGAWILSCIHTYLSSEPNRNDVVFTSRESYDWEEYVIAQEKAAQAEIEEQCEKVKGIMRKHHQCDCASEIPEDFWDE